MIAPLIGLMIAGTFLCGISIVQTFVIARQRRQLVEKDATIDALNAALGENISYLPVERC